MAKALLGVERLFLGNPRMPEYALNRLRDLGEKTGRSGDAAFVDRFTQFRLDVYDLNSAFERFAGILRAGGELGADVSVLKLWATETYQRITERSEEHTSELQSLMRISYAVFCLKKKIFHMQKRPITTTTYR